MQKQTDPLLQQVFNQNTEIQAEIQAQIKKHRAFLDSAIQWE